MSVAQFSFTGQSLLDLGAIAPEVILAVTVLAVILGDLFLDAERSYISGWAAAVGTVAAGSAALQQWVLAIDSSDAFMGMVVVDRFGIFFRLLILVSTFVVILMSLRSSELARARAGEYYALILVASMAAMLLGVSANFLMLYLAFETLSLPCYVLAGYRKGERRAAEASLKYLLFGAVASGVMIYGLSLLYGLCGSLSMADVSRVARDHYAPLMLSLALIMVGFAFKMSVVPFHFWTPDVYQGAPTPVTAYLSVVSKAAAFAAFLRFLAPILGASALAPHTAAAKAVGDRVFDMQGMLWILAGITMFVGNLVALRQTDIKRMLAYSSIAHAGYMLTALVAANQAGYRSILLYLAVYAIANLGVFATVIMVQNRTGSAEIAACSGLFYKSPTLAVSLGIMLWSLIGLPPTAGFVGKFYLFSAVIEKGQHSPVPMFYYTLVLLALVNSVISLYYYINVVKVMCFKEPSPDLQFTLGFSDRTVLATFAAILILIQLNWTPLDKFVAASVPDGFDTQGRAKPTVTTLPTEEIRVPEARP